MNWGSHSVDAVSKERIWREHVLTEKNTARIHEDFRCNPLKKDPPTAESINKRPARFLDRSAVIMDMLQKRLQRVKKNNNGGDASSSSADASAASTARSVHFTGSSAAAAPPASPRSQFQLPTRGMYGDSARAVQKPSSLPPIMSASTSNGNNASGRGVPQSPRVVGGTAGSINVQDFDTLFASAQLTPRDKYAIPQTSMQEIGWWNKPLITQRELDPRFRYGLSSCDVTKNGSAFVGSRRK